MRLISLRIRHSEWTLIVLFVLLALAASARAGVSVVHVPKPALKQQAAGAPAGTEDQDVANLARQHAEDQKAYGSLNNLNPMSSEYGKAAVAGAEAVVAPTGPLGQLYKLLSNPAVQGYLRFFNNPLFASAVDQILKHPNRMVLLYLEGALILALFIFRTWRLSKLTVSRWLAILWVNLWTFCVYVGAAVVVLPYAVLGEPYLTIIKAAYRTWSAR